MDFAVEDKSYEQTHDQGDRTSLRTKCRKKGGGKRKSNFKPPVNKRSKTEIEDIKSDSSLLENGLTINNANIQENILQKPETVKNLISEEKIVLPNGKNNEDQEDKNSENNETNKSCPLNHISDNIVKSLDSIFFPEEANDNISFLSLQNDLKSQQKHVSPSPKKNEFNVLEENIVDTYNLLEKEIGDELTMLKGSTQKEEHFLLSKTAISSLSDHDEQNELADNGENSVLTKFHIITLDNENKKEDENNITEIKNIYLKEQEKCINLECHADVKDFVDNENKLNTIIRHENLDNTENFKQECIDMRKNTEFQVTESVKETCNKVSLFQQNNSNSPALIDELLNGIKQADAIVHILSNGSDKENCPANGDITNIQFLKDITIKSLNKDNEKTNMQENCNEDGNGLANCTDCRNEFDHSSFKGTYKSPKHDPNTLVENSRASGKVEESGSSVFQGEGSKEMNSMDKSLVPQEKKLTLFYMNALDYDKEIPTNDGGDLQTDTETKDDEKHAQFLNASVNIETGSFEKEKVEINMEDINKNALNELDSSAIYSTNTDHHLTREKDELETSETNYIQQQNLLNTNTENVIAKKHINKLIHNQECIKSVCNDQNKRGSNENITHCDSADKENKFSVSCDTQQSGEVLTTETSYVTKEVPSTVSLAENSNSDCKYNKISHGDNATEKKFGKTDCCVERKCLKIPEMSLLVTATDYFKVEKVENTKFSNETENNRGIESMDNACIIPGQSHNKENLKENDTTYSVTDAEDSFDMDDDFDLTASQLSMIEVDERNHIKILKQEKENSSEETTKCVNTHFNLDSVTVDIMDQLCYIRESVESIKELLSMLLKEK